MQDCKNVYIFGYSGHAFVLIESMLELGYTILGYFDKVEAPINPYNISYCGYELDSDVCAIVKTSFVFPAVGDNALREKIVNLFIKQKLKQFVLIDKSANLSKTATIGLSTYVGKNTVVNARAEIGQGVILNTNAVIEHECVINDFTHIGPSATLAGNVIVGKRSFVGANAVCKQNIKLGVNAVLGAGSVLLKNMPNGETWVGNPAKIIKNENSFL